MKASVGVWDSSDVCFLFIQIIKKGNAWPLNFMNREKLQYVSNKDKTVQKQTA